MAKINQIRRLAIIVSKLNSKHYVPAEELVDYVSYTIRARYSDTAGCTLRTLQRDFRTIEELFGVTIRHDKLCGYYIDERYGSAEDYEALLLNFELLNAIDSDSTIQKYLLPEHHRAIILPNIAELLDAIRNRHPVEFDYILVRHGGKVVRKCLHPYFLKESQQRWYLIGYDTDDKLKAFGLDRLSSLRILSRERFMRNALDKRASEILRALLALQTSKIDNTDEAYMPVYIEIIDRSETYKHISLAHYGEQNGDMMRDPEMLFALHKETRQFIPYYYRNDYMGVEQYSVKWTDEGILLNRRLQADHTTFANQWLRNIAAQQGIR